MCFNLRRVWIVALIILAISCGGDAFQQTPKHVGRPFFVQGHGAWSLLSATQDKVVSEETVAEGGMKPCFYRTPEGRWKQRLNFVDLQVGQQLNGTVVQQLLNAKTGPKLFFECGVGRIDSKGDWQIVNGMLRFYSRGSKKSVVRKKAERFRKRNQVELFVSRVELDTGRFEVCTTMDAVEKFAEEHKPRIPASNLLPKQEVVGTVVDMMPYGVMVDVGANRNGLLHIQKVADLYGEYIDKEAGLEKAGLEKGAKLKLAVLSNEKKRLELDFTPDVKVEAEEERKRQEEKKQESKAEKAAVPEGGPEEVATQDAYDISDEEAAMWAAYEETEGVGEDEEEEYDEDRDIEDALGLGGY